MTAAEPEPAPQAAGRSLMDESVASPCVSVCKVEGELCVGCARSVAEIVDWAYLTAEEKRGVLAALPARARRLGAAT
jgi:hypothetical protein